MQTRQSRRKFLAAGSAALAGMQFTGCSSKPETTRAQSKPQGKKAALAGDRHAPIELPMPKQILRAPNNYPVLREILGSQGFTTCLVSDTYHMHKPSYGFGRGFDEVYWIRGQEGDPYVRDPRVKVDVEPFFKPRTGQPGEDEQTRQYLMNRH